MILATDDFNRADNADLGTDWEIVGSFSTFEVSSNKTVPHLLNADSVESNETQVWPDDHYSSAIIAALSGTASEAGIGVSVRGSPIAGPGNETVYRVVANLAASNNTTVAKFIANAYTLLAQGTVGWVANDRITLEVAGTTLTVKRNGTIILSTSDASIVSGNAGITYSSTMTTASLDDWEGGTVDVLDQSGTEPTITGVSPKMGAI